MGFGIIFSQEREKKDTEALQVFAGNFVDRISQAFHGGPGHQFRMFTTRPANHPPGCQYPNNFSCGSFLLVTSRHSQPVSLEEVLSGFLVASLLGLDRAALSSRDSPLEGWKEKRRDFLGSRDFLIMTLI